MSTMNLLLPIVSGLFYLFGMMGVILSLASLMLSKGMYQNYRLKSFKRLTLFWVLALMTGIMVSAFIAIGAPIVL